MIKARHLTWALFALLLPTLAIGGQGMSSKQYKNGLKVVVIEDKRAPAALFQIIYHVGGYAETPPLTGISHIVEHMMFKGTVNHPNSSYADQTYQMGAMKNAFTGPDYTGYFAFVGHQHLSDIFALEADRMKNLDVQDESFLKEIEVIKEERRMRTDDIPSMVLYERLLATAFPNGAYHDPLVGWMSDLDHVTSEDVRQWYQSWYDPSQAVILVIGDVNKDEVFKLANRHFKNIPSTHQADNRSFASVPLLGDIKLEVQLPDAVAERQIAYRTPSISSIENKEDAFALLLASMVLDGGLAARFETVIVRELELASMIYVDYDLFSRYESLFRIVFKPMPDKTLEEIEQAIYAQIQDIVAQGIGSKELKRAKQKLKAAFVFAQDSPMDRASWLSNYEGIGLSYEEMQNYIPAINEVTSEDVQRALKTYILDAYKVIGTLVAEENAHG